MPYSVSIIVPARNEKNYIEPLVKALPSFPGKCELIFVEGHSQDGTPGEIERVRKIYLPKLPIIHLTQEGKGKADAVWKGFSSAQGDVLMILDADMTVHPQELTKFYQAIIREKNLLVNGTRLVYPMEDKAMRPLNYLGNKGFAWLLTIICNNKLTDTLCGTKALYRDDFLKIQRQSLIGKIDDPYGDFTLLLGAVKLGLKIIEVPVSYRRRIYDQTKIRRFNDGWKLLKIVYQFLKE